MYTTSGTAQSSSDTETDDAILAMFICNSVPIGRRLGRLFVTGEPDARGRDVIAHAAERLRLLLVEALRLPESSIKTSYIVLLDANQIHWGYAVLLQDGVKIGCEQRQTVDDLALRFCAGCAGQEETALLPLALAPGLEALVSEHVHQHLLQKGGARFPVGTTLSTQSTRAALPRRLAPRPKTPCQQNKEVIRGVVDGVSRSGRRATIQPACGPRLRTSFDVGSQIKTLCRGLEERAPLECVITNAVDENGQASSTLASCIPVQLNLFAGDEEATREDSQVTPT